MSKMSSNTKSTEQSILPYDIDNEDYLNSNKSIYKLIFLHNPNLSKENKDHMVKYGIVREQRDETLCESLANIFNDAFKLAKEKKT